MIRSSQTPILGFVVCAKVYADYDRFYRIGSALILTARSGGSSDRTIQVLW